MKTKTSPITNSVNRSPCRLALPLISLALACFALSPSARAVDPPPDGGYPGGNTAEGEDALFSLTTGVRNTATGFDALFNNTTGYNNTALGFEALQSNTTGWGNTANGVRALFSNTTGNGNTANGVRALYNNTTEGANTAIGFEALFGTGTATGFENTAVGYFALAGNATGFQNTAIGDFALVQNKTGVGNTAIGHAALQGNTTGYENTANGSNALYFNTTGFQNTADGYQALQNNTTGNNNAGNGFAALFSNTTGNFNAANGPDALLNNTTGSNNTANGYDALHSNTTGGSNIALGFQAGLNLTTGSNNIDIGNAGVADESNTIRIGTTGTQTATFIAGIRDVTTGNGDAITVVIDSAGQLGTMSSSRRFKKEIKPMEQSSEALLGLKPVTFHYKGEAKSTPQFGLIAEDVAKVNPDLVARDANGEIYTVRYEAVNAMLLNEFLKEHRKVEEQGATIAELKKEMANLTTTVKEQAEQIQKVSAQFELSGPEPRTVSNNQ